MCVHKVSNRREIMKAKHFSCMDLRQFRNIQWLNVTKYTCLTHVLYKSEVLILHLNTSITGNFPLFIYYVSICPFNFFYLTAKISTTWTTNRVRIIFASLCISKK